MSCRASRRTAAIAAALSSLAFAAGAAAAPTVEVAEPPAVGEEPSNTATPRAPGGPAKPLALSSLRLPKRAVGQRGRARILIGVRLSRAGTITVQLQSLKDNSVVRTAVGETRQPKGRNYVRIDATDDSGFQLKPGPYRISISARDPRGRISNVLERNVRLVLTAPRGRFDAYLVPMLAAFKREGRLGHIVAAVGPKGPAAKAGIRRGDIVTRIGTHWIKGPGSVATALRNVKGSRKIPVRVKRDGKLRVLKMTPDPDWTERPDYEAVFRVATRRAPNDFAIHYAQVAQLLDVGELGKASARMKKWRASWRRSAPGQYLLGRILGNRDEPKRSLGAYLRAEKRDPRFSNAVFGQGTALNALGKPARAKAAFAKTERLDPKNASAPAFAAFVSLSEKDYAKALSAANRAVALDPLYADAHIPRGIALLKTGAKPQGLQALRRGLLDLPNRERAERIIREDLEPSDP